MVSDVSVHYEILVVRLEIINQVDKLTMFPLFGCWNFAKSDVRAPHSSLYISQMSKYFFNVAYMWNASVLVQKACKTWICGNEVLWCVTWLKLVRGSTRQKCRDHLIALHAERYWLNDHGEVDNKATVACVAHTHGHKSSFPWGKLTDKVAWKGVSLQRVGKRLEVECHKDECVFVYCVCGCDG